MSDKENSIRKESVGCLGNVLSAIIGAIAVLIVANKIPFPSAVNENSNTSVQNTELQSVLSTQIAQTAYMASSLTNQTPVLIFQSEQGVLEHVADSNKIPIFNSNVNIGNFIVEAKFCNPVDGITGGWDYGFIFRDTGGNQNYRLYIESDKDWVFNLTSGKDQNDFLIQKVIAQGNFINLDTSEGVCNQLRLIVENNTSIFFINDEYIATLDTSEKILAGNIKIGTGFINSHQIDGASTRYEMFTIYSLR